MNFIFFDVAYTLLHKPTLWERILNTLKQYSIVTDENTIKNNHKLLSESIKFPDKTSREFYSHFNAELLYSIGIIPTENLLRDMYDNCNHLPWKPFEDVKCIANINLPKGIISNWDNSLKDKLELLIDIKFDYLIGSENNGISKPNPKIFEIALSEISHLKSEKIYFVGDSIKLDIEPALKSKAITPILIDRDNTFPNYNGLKINTLAELKKIIS